MNWEKQSEVKEILRKRRNEKRFIVGMNIFLGLVIGYWVGHYVYYLAFL